jgi:hypothetical protein
MFNIEFITFDNNICKMARIIAAAFSCQSASILAILRIDPFAFQTISRNLRPSNRARYYY